MTLIEKNPFKQTTESLCKAVYYAHKEGLAKGDLHRIIDVI